MTIDGFRLEHRQAFAAFTPGAADRVLGTIDWLAERLNVEVRGLENVPSGRALIVGNHAFGWDVLVAMAAVWRGRQRPLWVLGDHVFWQVPFLRRVAAAVGTVDGTPENIDRLLEKDELVLVLPGGIREAVKPRELRYRLLWGHRYGFVRAAIKNGAPVVPLAAVGPDDLFAFVGSAYRRGERWLGKKGVPIPLPSRILPIPHLVHWTYTFGSPIAPPPLSEQADDPEVLKRFRHEIEGALHELLEEELAKRAGVELG